MDKKLSLFLPAATALCVGLLFGSQLVERGASAQRTNPAPREGVWEYCTAQVIGIHGTENKKTVGTGLVCYLKSSGAQCEEFQTMVDGPIERSGALATTNSLANIISKLGDDGWQMVGEGPWIAIKSDDKPLYFRRQK